MIECNFHQGRFNVRTGEVVLPPCMIPIKTYKTVDEDGVVYIEVQPQPAREELSCTQFLASSK